jgi:hypothetical protein
VAGRVENGQQRENQEEGTMVDRYTKAILTVIAVALTALAFHDFIVPLGAQNRDIQKVQICDGTGISSLCRC